MSDITLSKAVRSNLLSLQNTADMMSATQNKLATGKKVNSALDNPTNFFTASGLNSRAGDMNALLDSMANGIQTLEAADNGLSAITKTLESMQSTLRQARQDKTFETASYTTLSGELNGDEQLSFSGGAVGSTAVAVDLWTVEPATTATNAVLTGTSALGSFDASGGAQTFDVNGETVTLSATGGAGGDGNYSAQDIVDAINGVSGASNVTASLGDDGQLVLTSTDTAGAADSITVDNFTGGTLAAGDLGLTSTSASGTDAGASTTVAKSVDQLVSDINTALEGKVRASNDNGKLRVENLSTGELDISGINGSTGSITGSDSNTSSIGGNSVRADLATQYNELRDQLDKLADDASFNGINLLRGDNLQITFNETGTSELNIQSKDGESINSGNLGIATNMEASDFDSDSDIDGFLATVKTAINEVRSQSSAFGSSLSIVENRQDFTKNMINTLETGASNLTLADANEEAANLLALQTRQQLSSTALSMASQADQAVLRLF